MYVTGVVNIDMYDSMTKQYKSVLDVLGMHQHVTKPTRVTSTSRTLIDHIITNYPHCVSGTDIIPSSTVSDHDGVFARVPRYQPRSKLMRHEKNLNEEEFKKDCSKQPMSVVYCLESLEDMVETLNTLLIKCIDRHARIKVTRPPAPWKQSRVIQELKIKRVTSRAEAHATNTAQSWNAFKQVRIMI